MTATSNIAEYQRNWANLTARLGNDPKKALRKEGRLLFQELSNQTPPKTLSTGRRNVKRDVLRAVSPLSLRSFTEDERSSPLQRMLRKRDIAGLQKFIDTVVDSGPLKGVTIKPFSPSLHQEARDRFGRVKRDQKVVTLDTAEVRAHIRRKQGHVGQAMGGWAPALSALGGSPRAFANRWRGMGRFSDIDGLTGISISATNSSPWADAGADDDGFKRAIRTRSARLKVALQAAVRGAAFKSLKA